MYLLTTPERDQTTDARKPLTDWCESLASAATNSFPKVGNCRYSHVLAWKHIKMNKYANGVASLLVGILGFLVVVIGVTELLDPYVWPSLMLGLPVGLVTGIVLVPLTYLSLTYWEERRATGTASQKTVRQFWTTVAAFFGFVAGGGLAVVVLSTQAIGLASAILLAGFPVGIVSGALAAYLVFRRDWDRRSPPASPVR